MVRRAPRHGRAGDGRRLRAFDRGFRPRAAAVLPAVGAAGTVLPAAPAGRHRVRYDTWKSVKKAEALLKDDQGHFDLHRLCRPGLAALLARPQSATAERGLRRDRDRVEGRRGARADQGAAREGGRRRRAVGSARARRSVQFRAAGRLPGAVPRHRPRHEQGAGHRLPGARRDARRTTR